MLFEAEAYVFVKLLQRVKEMRIYFLFTFLNIQTHLEVEPDLLPFSTYQHRNAHKKSYWNE